ncbi:MAG: hypothetical protein EOO70_06705 [Myxococcaceae bacterium]|nr:MAG: hypothetical protein EOO70_06705 [Myxococcaceae bacterium]
MLIAVDDPAFMFFVGVCLLRGRREELLRCAGESLPEVLSQIAFKTEEDVDEVMRQSRELYQDSPKCFTRLCRLCCVGTIELTPSPPKGGGGRGGHHPHLHSLSHHSTAQLDIQELDEALSTQCTRHCLTLTPQELVNQLARIVIIDLRPPDEVEISGGRRSIITIRAS